MAKVISLNLMDLWRKDKRTLRAHLHGHKEFRIRIWLAMRLIALACWIWCVGLEFDEGEGESTA